MSHEKSSIGCLTSKCAISVMKSYQNLIVIARSKPEANQNPGLKDVLFYEACKMILDKAQVLSDLIDDGREKKHRPQIMYLLQLLQLQVIAMREQILLTCNKLRKHFSDALIPGLDSHIIAFGDLIKDIIKTSKEIEFLQGAGSVLETIARRQSESTFSRKSLHLNSSILAQDVITAVPDKIPTPRISTPRKSMLLTSDAAILDEETLEKVIELFNNKWKHGIQYLVQQRLIEGTTEEIAKFLFKYNERLSKAQLGDLLGGVNDKDTALLTQFTQLLNFKNDTFEQAIRKYLTKFQLPGEAQTISRVMETFASVYVNQNNPCIFPDADTAFVLAFSVIMLNTDAHKEAIAAKDKMTKEQFVWNNRGTWVDGADPPRDLLEEIYDNIVNNEIKMQKKGDPEKTGWLKLHGASKEGKKWFVLKGNELSWYKNPASVNTADGIRGKIILEYLNVKLDMEDGAKFIILNSLPLPFEIFSYDKGKSFPMSVKKLVFTAMTPGLAKAWVSECTANMTYLKVPEVPTLKSDYASKGKIQKKERRSSPWTSKSEGGKKVAKSNSRTQNDKSSGENNQSGEFKSLF